MEDAIYQSGKNFPTYAIYPSSSRAALPCRINGKGHPLTSRQLTKGCVSEKKNEAHSSFASKTDCMRIAQPILEQRPVPGTGVEYPAPSFDYSTNSFSSAMQPGLTLMTSSSSSQSQQHNFNIPWPLYSFGS